MPYLVQAAFWVGVIGTVAAAPLLCVLRMQRSYLSEALFPWSAPAVLFFTAALAFASVYELLPSSRLRPRIAGLIAGIVTFFGFAIWTSFMANVGRAPIDTLPGMLYSFAIAFVLFGWIPLGGGWIAGWIVSRLPDAPSEEAA
jgi:hypothetical protein